MHNFPHLHHLNLLYIEDSPSDQRLLQEVLGGAKDMRFSIRLASSLQEATIILQNSEPDIILCDLNLPEYRGKDTIDKVISLFPNKPIILLTESRNMEVTRYASSLGIQDFLVKEEDFDTMKLVRSIQMAKIRYDAELRKLLLINEELNKSLLELEESHSLIREQINNFSHKIRGPICTMEGLLNLLEEMPAEAFHQKIYINLRNTFGKLKQQVDSTVDNLEQKVRPIEDSSGSQLNGKLFCKSSNELK